ncbi:TetR/AcrR family transcriptional regulator [Streptomyces iconiensis]|uniref:Helix-turn-helix domain-containing protein n=1 Tax=Streptomyces iconiensis TaxID=1384038 RepID=A0ABT7A9J7_9ACTN|nr:TetR/AcrR family transcriptional regulator [Streptomyces iconiensis]MDJ1138034.1 helix-turn-helix domain-containing protein [Streptomyces iconiensis]
MSRGNTRQRIQDVALEMFAERGYEKSSLREIAEQLGVTKAALYYHFKTKEDIVISIVDDLAAKPCAAIVAWAEHQPRTLETKLEVLRRYSGAVSHAARLFRFMQENQAAMRELSIGETMKSHIFTLLDLLRDEDAALADQVRCSSALFTIHATPYTLREIGATSEEKRKAALEVAQELVTRAHQDGEAGTTETAKGAGTRGTPKAAETTGSAA